MRFKAKLRAAVDTVYFAKEYLNFEASHWQAEALNCRDRQVVLNCSRQSGKSTVGALHALHEALFFPNSRIAIISPTQGQSDELFRKVKEFYKAGGFEFEFLEDNKRSLQLSNGSRILSLPGDAKRNRGLTLNLVIVDEAAGVPNDVIKAARPMLGAKNGRFILASTPLGTDNYFYRACNDLNLNWTRFEVPASRIPWLTKGFLERERIELGDRWFEQEYFCRFLDQSETYFSFSALKEALDDNIPPLFLPNENDQLFIHPYYRNDRRDGLRSSNFMIVDPAKSEDLTGIVIFQKFGKGRKAIFHVIHIARPSHGTTYRDQFVIIKHMLDLMTPVMKCKLVLDHSGVGAALHEFYLDRGLRSGGVIIKPKGEARGKKNGIFKVAKQEILENAQAKFKLNKVRIAGAIPLAMELISELSAIEMRVTEHGNIKFVAGRSGVQDDLADALNIGLWYALYGVYEGGLTFA